MQKAKDIANAMSYYYSPSLLGDDSNGGGEGRKQGSVDRRVGDDGVVVNSAGRMTSVSSFCGANCVSAESNKIEP